MEFEDLLKKRTLDEIDVGRGMRSAKGSSGRELVSLYNQMQVKTNMVFKRTELNKTLNVLCMASGTTKNELEEALPSFKMMPDEEKPLRSWTSAGRIAYEQIGPVSPLSDNLFAPIWRTHFNKTWYGGKIEIAKDLEHREAGERYKIWDENTSAFAKMVCRKFNISPKKVDNVLNSYTGIIYDMGIIQTSAKNDIQGRFKYEGVESGVRTMLGSPWSHAFVVDSIFSNAHKSD